MKNLIEKEIHNKMKKTLWKEWHKIFLTVWSTFIRNLSESYVGRTPPPERLTDWHLTLTVLFFIINKHDHHGTDSTASLPGHMHNTKFRSFFCTGVARRHVWNWLREDKVISTQLPPPQPFSVVPPPKLSLSHVYSSPNCRHMLIVTSDGCCRTTVVIAISLLPSHWCRHYHPHHSFR